MPINTWKLSFASFMGGYAINDDVYLNEFEKK